MSDWVHDAIFYHIYPLGFCGAPEENELHSTFIPRLEQIHDWIPHLKNLNINALYLGPLFESGSHGYDTSDYFTVDRRLGTNSTLATLISALHANGIRIILDGVFNHVGRKFPAFLDLVEKKQDSVYRDWFSGLSFTHPSPYGDPFSYDCWNGHYNLVKLDLSHPAVKEHLLSAVDMWIQELDIDGLRLDAADCLDMEFIRELRSFCETRRHDFWLMGEIIHGDYRKWTGPEKLHSVTNYECYKGLYSSHVDKNYFEIAYSLNRQFGSGGLYEKLPLYNFADNHDVNRVASMLKNKTHLYPLYCLLFTMPGVPSVYYGSEWGMEGEKTDHSDRNLRPGIYHETMNHAPHPDLARVISRLACVRFNSHALKHGTYRQVYVNHEQFAFIRQTQEECIVVCVNSAAQPVTIPVSLPDITGRHLEDILNPGEGFRNGDRQPASIQLPPYWARILVVR